MLNRTTSCIRYEEGTVDISMHPRFSVKVRGVPVNISKQQLADSASLPREADPPSEQATNNAGQFHPTAPQRTNHNPLLNLPIARRLALGFLIPALIAS